MIFDIEPIPTPTTIGNMELRLRTDADGGEYASFFYEVLAEDGSILQTRRGDAGPHFTPAEIQGLRSLMARVRGLARSKLPQQTP